MASTKSNLMPIPVLVVVGARVVGFNKLSTLPGGVPHVPSPRQKVPPEAPVPLLRFATGRLPVTSVARLIKDVPIAPAVAFRKPDNPFTVSEPVTVVLPVVMKVVKRLVEDAVVANSLVLVALPVTSKLPVVVAPPAMVRPLICVPPPMVEDAVA